MATRNTATTPVVEAARSAVSWSAVTAGATVATALSIMLLAIGGGIGLVSISPWAREGISAESFGWLTIAWFAAVQLFALGVGGFLAGRLRTRWVGVPDDEVFFRDTAHGFLVWAVGTVAVTVLLASAAATVASGAAVAGGAALRGAGEAAVAVIGNGSSTSYLTDRLFRGGGAQPAGEDTSLRIEVDRIVWRTLADGEIDADDRSYVADAIARQTGIDRAEAEARLDGAIEQAKTAAAAAETAAREAAETARKLGIKASLWAFVGLLIGALSASYMATIGGRMRDDLPALG